MSSLLLPLALFALMLISLSPFMPKMPRHLRSCIYGFSLDHEGDNLEPYDVDIILVYQKSSTKDIFSPIMFNVSPEFNVISIFRRSFECFLISSETIYVPSPHGSSIDITKCDAFSIRSFTFDLSFLMGEI